LAEAGAHVESAGADARRLELRRGTVGAAVVEGAGGAVRVAPAIDGVPLAEDDLRGGELVVQVDLAASVCRLARVPTALRPIVAALARHPIEVPAGAAPE